MPQMSPLNWMILYIMFLLIFFMFNILNYYFINYNFSYKMSNIKKYVYNWKW
uniref:ATP synthase complex subunit 8 n=1 Tax=Pselaphinae sp. 1 EF-2015 TaxID=1756853 RepID=A0A0S2M8J2_9COLE|nr:ATP synthase F0 subunit 8 [Pselaphinae sp. 1 EF-2015]